MALYGYICRDTGRPCEFATINGYCMLSACALQPQRGIINIKWPWMKPKEKQ